MRKCNLVLLCVLITLAGCSKNEQKMQSLIVKPEKYFFDDNWNPYFPLREGNYWKLKSDFFEKCYLELRIPGFVYIHKTKFALLEVIRTDYGSPPQHLVYFVTYDKNGVIRKYWPSDEEVATVPDYSSALYLTQADSGTSWGWGGRGYGKMMTLISKGTTEHVAAGSFKNCLSFRNEHGLEMETVDCLARDIGPIRWDGYSLMEYKLR